MRNFVRPGKAGPDKRPYGAVLVVAAIAVVMIATAVVTAAIAVVMIATAVVTTAITMIAVTVVVVAIAIVMTAATVVIAAVVIVTAGAVIIATVGVMITVTIVVTAHLAHAVVIIAIAAMAQAASAAGAAGGAVLNHNLPRIGRYICHGLRQSKGAGHGKNCGEKENTVHLYVSCVGHLWRIKAFTPELFVKMRGAGPKAVDRAPATLTNTGSRQRAGKEIGIGFIRGNYAADGMAINPSLGPWPDLGRM